MTNKLEAKRAHWRHHIQNWKTSGLTQKAYCESHHLKLHQFWYWQRQVRTTEETVKARSAQVATAAQQDSGNAFIPVCLDSSHALATPALSLELPNGIRIHGIEHASRASLQSIVETLV